MKRYRLIKDLPTIEAGRIFEETKGSLGGTLLYATGFCSSFTIDKDGIKNFDEWFEEIKEPKIFFTIDIYKSKFKKINTDYYSGWSALEVKNIKDLGLLFKTVEKTKKYLKYLKAKEIIKQDAKGFKPDWENFNEEKYYGVWDFDRKKADYFSWGMYKGLDIYFKSKEDIKESFKKHPKEWKAYLTYDQ